MTAAELLQARREDLRLARIDLRNAAAKYGALANRRPQSFALYGWAASTAFEEATDALENASRRLTWAELEVATAETAARAEQLAREAQAEIEAEEQARRARRSHLCVIDGGG